MAIKSKIAVNWPNGFPNPVWAPFGISTVDSFADWLDAKYHLMVSWTGYDPAAHHGRVLVYERFQNDDPMYDPNTRRVNLRSINEHGQMWFVTLEFFAYCLHEMAHDFTRWDEQYCQQRVGIEPLTLALFNASPHQTEIKRVVESLCEYFKKRLLA